MGEKYAPLHVHSYYSLLDGLPSPKDIATRCKELGLPACAMTDHGNICGLVAFYNACTKKDIRPILGCELYICEFDPTVKSNENKRRWHLTVLAKGQAGLETMMRLVSETNRPDFFYRKPRINLDRLAAFAEDRNLLCLSGCLAGMLSSSLFDNFDEACKVSTQTESMDRVRAMLKMNWQDIAVSVIQRHQQIFGKDNFFLEIQDEGMAIQRVVAECLRKIGAQTGVPTVATLDAHYCRPDEAQDQRILLYSQLHTTQEEQERLRIEGGDTMYFFHSDTFHIYTPEEMLTHYEQAEVDRTLEIADRCGSFKLGRQPCLPKFTNDELTQMKLDSDRYLESLCIKGAKQKLAHLPRKEKQQYLDRLNRELLVIREATLSDYFLIVYDACQFVDRNGGPRGKGRGSGAGSLVNYLIGITDIDPLVYGLYFERFYNASRNIPAHFDAGNTEFMAWLGENFESAVKRDKSEAKRQVAIAAANARRACDLKALKDEAAWIDEDSPKMWLYLEDLLKAGTTEKTPNPSNSHIAYAVGLTDELDKDRPVKKKSSHVSLPDIDTDIGVVFRSRVIAYLSKRWGEDRVSQMITFGRLQGKAALKEVFRAQPETVKQLLKVKALKEAKNPDEIAQKPHDLCNEITQHIPDEAAISDDLRQAREETGNENYGILQWAIDNIEPVATAYETFKPLFDQAMRLEGVKKSQSKHAAGMVIADRPISELVPMVYDPKSKMRVCGLEMANAEAMGAVKFDFLGVTALDKLWYGQALVNREATQPFVHDEVEAGEESE